jgi:acyl-CoA hydrolase
LLTGNRRHTNSCYLTFVAIDKDGRPVEVPLIMPETPDEERRYEAAMERRRRRLEERQLEDAAERKTAAATERTKSKSGTR